MFKGRESQEEKVARRRAEWDRRVTESKALDTQREELGRRKEAVRKEQEQARAASVLAKVERLSKQGKPYKLTTIGIAVMDGKVYINYRSGPRLLGPLVGASALIIELRPKKIVRSDTTRATFFVITGGVSMNKVKTVARATVTVSAGGKKYERTIEGLGIGIAKKEASRFNMLAAAVREES
jgi:hypothetical protein